MMNYIWGSIMVVSVLSGIATDRVDQVSQSILSGATQAVELCVTLLGMLVLWGGLTEIMQVSGLSDLLGKLISPVVKWLFPELKYHNKARNAIALSMAANVLGLGNAATPLGLKAMDELQRINHNSFVASNSMVTFVVLNSVSIQLIPTGIAVLRNKYHSAAPMEVMIPIWVVSIISVIVGVGLAVLLNQRRKRHD